MKTRILVNAISAKKHAGGGFQIAYNFVKETLHYDEVEWYYLASSDIDEQIGAEFKELRDKRYFVFPTQPDFLHSYWRVRKEVSKLEQMIKPDLVYSVLAPSYFCFKSLEVMRYANPWVTHPNKFSISRLSLKQRIKTIQIQSNTNRSVIPIRNKPPRTDAYGHKIIKGNKKHCISFIDTIDKRTSIAEVLDISTQKKTMS